MTDTTPALLLGLESMPEGGPEWLLARREAGALAARRSGLPTKRDEAWRFTPTQELSGTDWREASQGDADPSVLADLSVLADVTDEGVVAIAVVDGRLPAELPELPEGLTVTSLSAALEADDPVVAAHLGAIAGMEHFAGVNAALFTDGVVVRAERGAVIRAPLQLVHLAARGDEPNVAYPRVLIVVEERAQLSVVETFLGRAEGAHLTNVVTEVVLAPGAVLDHARVTHDAAHHVGTLAVRQERASLYRASFAAFGGLLSRLDLGVSLVGEGAECTLDGVYHAAGEDLVDNHVVVDHLVGKTKSRMTFRGVLDEKGRAVFDGISRVLPKAAGAEAHQENRNLLLSTSAGVHTKPHLEIEVDEVVASHGATVGALDADQLFYLRARAIGEEQARAMLTYAFVRSVIDRVRHEPLRVRLARAFAERLPDGESLREIL